MDASDFFRTLAARYENSFHVAMENQYNHKRCVTPGDHQRKLRPETIAMLNNRLKDVLDMLGAAHD